MLDETHFSEISKLIQNSTTGIVSIIAPTGSGKTQAIPPYLAKALDKRVFVAVPTREAARSNYLAVKNLGKNQNLAVGYAAGGKVAYDENTRIIYATSGHIKNMLLSVFQNGIARPSSSYILVLDEFHTQIVDNTIILGLWRKIRDSSANAPTLVLTSATSTVIQGFTNLASEYKITLIPKYTITPKYTTKSLKGGKQLYDEMVNIAINETGNDGHVLLFVPSIAIADELAARISKLKENALVIALHSKTLEKDEILALSPSKRRKYIVATNVVESSITIPDVAWVIDSMLEKVPETSFNGGKRLVEKRITMMSSIQRAGRTGRTCNGVYYSMMKKDEKLIPNRIAEYLRLPIYNEVLEIIASKIDPAEIFPGLTDKQFQAIYDYMEKYGAIAKRESISYVTNFGKFSAIVGLSIPISRFLWLWLKSGEPTYWGVVIASIIETDLSKLFYIPNDIRSNRTTSEYAKYIRDNFSDFFAPDQLGLVLNLWLRFEVEMKESLKAKLSQHSVKKWTWNKKIDTGTLVSISEILIRTLSKLQRVESFTNQIPEFANLHIEIGTMPSTSLVHLMERATPIFVNIFYDRVLVSSGSEYRSMENPSSYTLSKNIPCGFDQHSDIISLDEIELQSGGKNTRAKRSIITLAIYKEFNIGNYKSVPLPKLTKIKQEPITIPHDWFEPTERPDDIFLDFDDISPEDIGYRNIQIPPALAPKYLLGIKLLSVNKVREESPLPILTVPTGTLFQSKRNTFNMEDIMKKVVLPPPTISKGKVSEIRSDIISAFEEMRIPFSLKEFQESSGPSDIRSTMISYTFD